MGGLLTEVHVQALPENRLCLYIRKRHTRSGHPREGQRKGRNFKRRTLVSPLPAIRECLATDVEAAFDGDPRPQATTKLFFPNPGFLAIASHRLPHELYKMKVPIHPPHDGRIRPRRHRHRHSPRRHHRKIFFIDHGTGVVISPRNHPTSASV